MHSDKLEPFGFKRERLTTSVLGILEACPVLAMAARRASGSLRLMAVAGWMLATRACALATASTAKAHVIDHGTAGVKEDPDSDEEPIPTTFYQKLDNMICVTAETAERIIDEPEVEIVEDCGDACDRPGTGPVCMGFTFQIGVDGTNPTCILLRDFSPEEDCDFSDQEEVFVDTFLRVVD